MCRSGREENRFPRVSRDRNKARIRVIVEHVSSSVSRTSVHTDVYPPPFRIEPHHETSGDSTRERVWALLGRPSVPHHWGQRSTWVFRFLGNRTFCFQHLLDPSSKIFATKNVSNIADPTIVIGPTWFTRFFFFSLSLLNRPPCFLINYRGPFVGERMFGGRMLGGGFSLSLRSLSRRSIEIETDDSFGILKCEW